MSVRTIPLSRYVQETGETSQCVQKRLERGVWAIGKHVLQVKGVRERWIDLDEVEKWARGQN